MDKPELIKGEKFVDQRGALHVNNKFDASQIKRMYIIENINPEFIRGWQGHKIEQRWFSATRGSFTIRLIRIDNWKNPSKDLAINEFMILSNELNVLHIPAGYVSSIQALEQDSRLLVMADTFLGEIKDEYRYPADYFSA